MTDRLSAALQQALSPGAVLVDPAEVAPFVTDWYGRYRGSARCVVRPRSTAEVAAGIRLCAEHKAPIVPQGGNTSVCGGSVPDDDGRAVVFSLGRMNAIRDLDVLGNVITVEAGCVLQRVQEAADAVDRLFPLSLSAEGSCQIGGNISTNAGGTAVLRYGNARELVLGLEAVLPDGQIWDGLRPVRKDSTGYDLKSLLIGAEGTLGIITAAALKLFPRARDRATAWLALGRLDAALELLALMQGAFDTHLTAFELMSRDQVEIVYRHVPNTRSPLDPSHPWVLLIELTDTSANAGLSGALEDAVGRALERGLVCDAIVACSGQQAKEFWAIRHALADALRAAGVSLAHDVALPLSAIPRYVERTDAAVRKRFPQALTTIVCHLGDGNVHYNLTFPPEVWATLPDPHAFNDDVAAVVQAEAVALHGTFVAEHGIGQKNLGSVALYKSPVELSLLRAIKTAIDPAGIMNPGRTLPMIDQDRTCLSSAGAGVPSA